MRIRVPDGLEKITRRFSEAGHRVYLVGGAVRDALLGLPVKDYDVATDAPPGEVMKLFRRVIPTGLKHGTVTVLEGGGRYEVTTFRIEGGYSDRRRPDAVTWTTDLDEDLKRRDFTINAIAYDLRDRALHDPFDGRGDLKRRIIRAIGAARERFEEDPLRVLRAVRFSVQLGFAIEDDTRRAMADSAPLVAGVSAERIRDEFSKILAAETPSAGIETLEQSGVLKLFLPELSACRGVRQPALHCFDVFYHSLYACDGAPADRPVVRLAALLHDIGKPAAAGPNQAGDLSFHRHELAGSRMATEILVRLRFPTAIVESVSHLVACHMFNYDGGWKDAAVRRFVRRVGREHLADLYALRRADQYGLCRRPERSGWLEELERRASGLIEEGQAFSLKDLAVNGHDLKRELGIAEGRTIGLVLEFLMESVLDDPALNVRERLQALARRYYEERLR